MSWQATPAHIFSALKARPARRVFEKIKGQEPPALEASPAPIPVHIVECEDCQFDFRHVRLAQITIERCRDVTVRIGSCIGAVEIIKCQATTLDHPGDVSATITLDNCTDCHVNLHVDTQVISPEDLGPALKLCTGISVFSTSCSSVSLGVVAAGTGSGAIPAKLPRYSIPDDVKEGNKAWRHRTRVVEGGPAGFQVVTQLVNLYGDVVQAEESE